MRPPSTLDVRGRRVRRAALPLALALLLGCSSGGPDSGSTTSRGAPPSPAVAGAEVGAAASSTAAAELQAGLTALLVERTYLVAAASAAVGAPADGGRAGAAPALAALDDASTALADLLGATYSEARRPVLEALRRDDRLLAERAAAVAGGDAAATAQAREELVAAQGELAEVVRRVVPALDAEELEQRMGADLRAQDAATGAEPYTALGVVAQEAVATARLLADGVAADRGLGSPGTPAARLRAGTAALLTEHVALVGALAGELRAQRTPSVAQADRDRAAGARAALQVNAEQLADLLGEPYPALRAPFLRAWTAHLDRLAGYATARAGSSAAAPGGVAGFPAELARLLAEHVGGLPVRSAVTELDPALTALLRAVDARAAGQPGAASAVRAAVTAAQRPSAFLVAAVAEDLQLA